MDRGVSPLRSGCEAGGCGVCVRCWGVYCSIYRSEERDVLEIGTLSLLAAREDGDARGECWMH